MDKKTEKVELSVVDSLAAGSDEKYFEHPACVGVRVRFIGEQKEENMVRVHLTRGILRERFEDGFDVEEGGEPYVALDVPYGVLEELFNAVKKQREEVK